MISGLAVPILGLRDVGKVGKWEGDGNRASSPHSPQGWPWDLHLSHSSCRTLLCQLGFIPDTLCLDVS